MYNIYRNDRAPNTKDKSHGGVLLAITKDFIGLVFYYRWIENLYL
jgi:hypothetical protein